MDTGCNFGSIYQVRNKQDLTQSVADIDGSYLTANTLSEEDRVVFAGTETSGNMTDGYYV